MAKIAKPPVPYKAYRHFAIITVVVTGLLALFASGENREVVADRIEQQEREAHLRAVSAERTGRPRIGRRDATGQGRFDGGDRQEFGRPMDDLSAGNSSTMENFTSPGAARRGQTTQIPGYSQAYLDSLSEEEYRRLLQNLRAAGMLSPEERAQTLANLEAGSRQRSGAATPSDGTGMVN